MTTSTVARIHFTAVASVTTADSVGTTSTLRPPIWKWPHGTARLPIQTDVTHRRSDPHVQNVQVNHQYRSSSSGKTRTVIECIVRHCSEQAAGERRCVDAAAASQNSGRQMGTWTNRHIWYIEPKPFRTLFNDSNSSSSTISDRCWWAVRWQDVIAERVLLYWYCTRTLHAFTVYTIQTARARRVRTRWLTMTTEYELCTHNSQRRLSSRPTTTRTRRHNQTRLVVVRQSTVVAWQQKPSETVSTVYYYFIFPISYVVCIFYYCYCILLRLLFFFFVNVTYTMSEWSTT